MIRHWRASPSTPGEAAPAGRFSVVGAATAAGGLALALAFAGWEGTQQRDSVASHAGVAGSMVVVLTAALVAGWGRQQSTSADWARGSVRPLLGRGARPQWSGGVAIWALIVLAVVGWDLASFVAQSHDLPTFSYLVGRVTHVSWGRAAVFTAWLAVGLTLALWNRTRTT